MAEGGVGRSLRLGALAGLVVLPMVMLLVVAMVGWDESVDGPLADSVLGMAVVGLPAGALIGGAMWGFDRLCRSRDEKPRPIEPPTPRHVDLVWLKPVERCEESARAVARLLGTLPGSAAADWLTKIAKTMTTKLAEIQMLADAGQAVVPVFTKRDVARARAHPLYAQLERAADEFADVADQVGRAMVELHTPPELDLIRAQLEVLTQQLPLLR
ncbi:hypothetical protein [Actinocrispum sp. NPDC049592]|uniref:hypothetical protein n=1 Tax=Actinocrispum sp. NPDC049592 TaxID=3154835 RepID=UPI003427B7F4